MASATGNGDNPRSNAARHTTSASGCRLGSSAVAARRSRSCSLQEPIGTTRDSSGRLLAYVLSGAYRVGAGEVWLFGFNNRRSWDARYFGSIPEANLLGVLGPVVTW